VLVNELIPKLGRDEVKRRLFKILDASLGTFKTPFQARTYKKVIKSLEKVAILEI